MKLLYLLLVGLSILFLGCTPNKAYRTLAPEQCDNYVKECQNTYLEEYNKFDLAYLEFTERGNLFSNERALDVLNFIDKKSQTDQGAIVVVFIHGWKHNASSEDTNVKSFRKVLDQLSQSNYDNRRLIGVYLGWRGASIDIPVLDNITFWDRKTVAEKMGKGVADALLNLRNITDENPKNLFLTVGHSFGGAITLSATNKFMLANFIEARRDNKPAEPFGDGIILINPAIEANEILQLKEASMQLGQREDIKSNPIMHVISSRGDTATHWAFPAGQFLGTALTWNEEKLERTYFGQEYILNEYDLDLETIGNYSKFHTGELLDKQAQESLEKETKMVKVLQNGDTLKDWKFVNHCENQSKAYLPCTNTEPLQFLYTSKSFIGDHNDIFNENVVAYLSSVVSEALYNQDKKRVYPQCLEGESFNFAGCFNLHYEKLK